MTRRFRFGFLALTWLVTSSDPSAEPTPPHSEHTNRLAHEKSPYLLQHAHNPVDWYPWGEEAFAKARREKMPIFLSVGYSTCHWCHVMAHESFENEEVAAIMNREFVNIKVDREERPDVDRVYMTFVQATTGGGGWPMSVWLTPDLKPFVGGTYFPPEARYGQPGFKKVLERIATAWKENHDNIVEQGGKIVAALQESQSAVTGAVQIEAATLDAAYQQLDRSYDPKEGGFGNAPKFPRPVTINFLTRFYARDPKSDSGKHALEMALFTLRKMAAGGMHDHIGGGFHRYSVDRYWHVPHFEKMLYDQAQLAVAYLDAFQITRDRQYEAVARDILDYVAVDDVGTIINPLLAAGQIHGGVVQGIAQALYEEVSYDLDTGQLMTGSLLDYAVPRAEHVPKIRSLFQETPSPTNPIGVKGIGESGSIAAPPCIVHAVLDALSPFGISHLDMPMTPPRIWSAIQAARMGASQ